MYVRDGTLENKAIIVNKRVWKALRQIYGGGPSLAVIFNNNKEGAQKLINILEDNSIVSNTNEESKIGNIKSQRNSNDSADDDIDANMDYNIIDVDNQLSVPQFSTY